MKKRIFSIALALVLSLALAVPALAAEEPEPEYRLAKVVSQEWEYTFSYGQGGYLPTEVLQNGGSYVTASYDEAGRATSIQSGDESDEYVYDEAGNCVRSESTINFGDGPSTTVVEYSYDEDGNCVREERTNGDWFTSVTEYTYDEAGSCIREEITSDYEDGSTVSVTEYDYDDAGNCIREEHIYTGIDGAESAYSIECTYDEEDRILNRVFVDDEGGSDATYTYGEDGRSVTETYDNGNITVEYEVPLLDVDWVSAAYDLGDGNGFSQRICTLTLEDSAGNHVFEIPFSCSSEPVITYDDNGYLIKGEGAGGETIELTYEPVA